MESACFPLKEAIYMGSWRREFCYPGRKVPEWFKSNASNNISIELSSTTTDLIGFVLCSVLYHHPHGDHLQCQLYYDGKKNTCSKFEGRWKDNEFYGVKTNFIHIMFFYGRETDSEKFVDGVIEACGVCPIYASEYLKFIQQMELEANLAAQKETCQDAYETSFHGILKYANFSLKTGEFGNLEGSNIPKWFTYNSSMVVESSISFVSSSLYVSVQVAPDLDKLMGFIFGFVIPDFSSKEREQCYSTFMGRLDYEEGGGPEFFGPNGWHYSMIKLNSDVFLWYDPFNSECILKRLKNIRQRMGSDAKIDLTFVFDLGYGLIDDERGEIRIDNCLIKEFGVRPIYVSEYTNFLQQEKMKEVKDSSIDQPNPKNSESTNANCNKQIFEEYICSVIILGQEKLTTKTMDAVVLHVLFATNFLIKKYEVFITVRGEDTATKMMCS
ncbi:hypothetical protein K1719_009252 [Acacia pycnantha]|nr:hypothetical protein K1719_009252 [Acacia pycnantha]